jgi:outer membrane protein assembly factor BamB
MYMIKNTNDVIAINAVTGVELWNYSHTWDPTTRNPCCGRLSRGLAILGNTLFLAAFDTRMIAIDARTGKEIWKTSAADPKQQIAFTNGPDCDQEQGHRRNSRRGKRHSRISCRVGCRDREGSLAIQYGSWPRRTRQ